MKLFSDLHMHSRYARACSKDLRVETLEKWAAVKGINLLGTGDFTHPLWLAELKEKLKRAGEGFFSFENKNIFFCLTAEVSLIYNDGKALRRVHHILTAPSFEVVEQINDFLGKKGKLASDGRPIIGKLPSPELVERCMEISKDILVIPAHCLMPNEKIICNPEIKPISAVNKGDKVLTHKGIYKKVAETFVRNYNGKVYRIQPYYFTQGITVTEEHPFLAIKTVKNCSYLGGLCKPNSIAKGAHKCRKKHYKNYKVKWIPAKDLEINDIILYPRIKKIFDIKNIKISDIVKKENYRFYKQFIIPKKGRQDKPIKNIIKITPEFCRLVGYYLSEGCIIKKNNSIQFSFGQKEHQYINDVVNLMKKCFGIKIAKKRKRNGYELYFYSKAVMEMFDRLFYETGKPRKAFSKRLPEWALYLDKKKQAEILRGWWRGDAGVSVSELLSEQMKIICLRLKIIPSIARTTKEYQNKTKRYIGKRLIRANYDCIIFRNLSFYEDRFNLLKDLSFKKFKTKLQRKHGWVDENYIYIPIKKIGTKKYSGPVYNLEVEDHNSYVAHSAAVHNCMTPWFALFGSKSGFNSLKECFGDQTKNVFAVESGMSADPSMLWRMSQLENISIVSNSDSHSYWPWRMGREANVFDLSEPNYFEMVSAIKEKNPKKFLYTIEVDPGYGKYHVDGHRACGIQMEPAEALKLKNICPVCKKELTIGVLHRVEELADRPVGFVPKGAIPFKTLLPLSELIAVVLGAQTHSKKVWEEYNKLIARFGNEINVLLEADEKDLRAAAHEKIAEIILKNRLGEIKVKPGFDGVYGTLVVDGREKILSGESNGEKSETPKKKIEKPKDKIETPSGLKRFLK